MTTFRTRSDRAIARSRGHLKKAEEAFSHEAIATLSFSMSKANHALQIGKLHEAARLASAAEINTIIHFLEIDPETDLGEAVAPEEATLLIGKVRMWLTDQIATKEENGDDD